MALAATTQESLYLVQLLNGMDNEGQYELKIFEDNQGAIALSNLFRDVNISTSVVISFGLHSVMVK